MNRVIQDSLKRNILLALQADPLKSQSIQTTLIELHPIPLILFCLKINFIKLDISLHFFKFFGAETETKKINEPIARDT